MWSIGVILYNLLCGYEPFIGTSKQRTEQIIAGKYQFYEDDWDYVSDDAKDLVRCLMNTRPSQRISAKDALEHPWIHTFDLELSSRDLSDNLRNFQKTNVLRRLKARVKLVSSFYHVIKINFKIYICQWFTLM